MEQTFSISGGSGSGTIGLSFTADGSPYALAYIDTLVGAVNNILANGGNTNLVQPQVLANYVPLGQLPDGTPIYQLAPSTIDNGPHPVTYDIPSAGYVIDSVAGAVILNGDTAGGSRILVAGANLASTVNTFGSDNLVIFVSGGNEFDGSTTGGNETVIGGQGTDTIRTGTGSTTVNAGSGQAIVYLNDTGAGGGAFNDAAYLDSGTNLVISNGTSDIVVASSEGQTVVGGALGDTANSLTVVLAANMDGTANGNDLVNGGDGITTVFDNSSANTIQGGNGSLVFVGGANVTATFNAGDGSAVLFGAAGDVLTIGDVPSATGETIFLAGGGNETLNGANSESDLKLFGAAQVNAADAVDSISGGLGNDTLVAGAGQETLAGAAGDNVFLIDRLGAENANLTIADFSGNDTIAFGHYSATDVNNAVASGVATESGFVVTFAESSTTITFTNIQSADELTGHVVTFG